jgi:hypothetical protein
MPDADPDKGQPCRLFTCHSGRRTAHCPQASQKKRSHRLEGDSKMRRIALVLALAIAAPVLSGCIIIATDKPTTRVVHSTPEAAQ